MKTLGGVWRVIPIEERKRFIPSTSDRCSDTVAEALINEIVETWRKATHRAAFRLLLVTALSIRNLFITFAVWNALVKNYVTQWVYSPSRKSVKVAMFTSIRQHIYMNLAEPGNIFSCLCADFGAGLSITVGEALYSLAEITQRPHRPHRRDR